jgi:hypothetical protein
MKVYLNDRRAWDWNEPLTMMQAKTFLWSLDRQDVYVDSEDEDEDDEDEEDEDQEFYVQAPNVPKEQVRELLKKLKEDYKKGKPSSGAGATSATAGAAASAGAPKTKMAAKGPGPAVGANSQNNNNNTHTQSTLSTSVTDTLKAFEDIIGHQEVTKQDTVLAQKEEENSRLRVELNECQEQLSMLHSMVKQLKVDMDRTSKPAKKAVKKKKTPVVVPQEKESSSEDEEEEDDESSSESEDDEEDDWSQERGARPSDDDETISTFHVNAQKQQLQTNNQNNAPQIHTIVQGNNGSNNGNNNGNNGVDSNPNKPSSAHSRAPRPTVRKTSIHSRRSMRRDSVHSSRSIHSRSRHSIRRNSIHSRRSMSNGMDDDDATVVSQSLQSVSPSIKSLPREIELMDDEDDDDEDNTQGKDDYSFFDDSYRKPDDDARSVGSRSAASRASRRSTVSGARSRGRNARKVAPKQPKAARGGNVPREIDLSGDELEDETYANVSTDTLFVTDKQIVDPYGEKGVYTGALSKSTGMPNGKGRLEYEKEGRWYEGDWIHGRWTGYGRLSNGDGDFYEGGLKNDHKHGTGIMRFADGRVFEGEYIRGQMIQGKMTYQDGSVYGGSWVDGMRHGRGKCIFVDGSEYEGEFREGNFHGQGKMTWNDGGWYIGEWCDGEMHGKGKEIRPDGTLRHDGEWSRGQPIRSANESSRRRRTPAPSAGVEAA